MKGVQDFNFIKGFKTMKCYFETVGVQYICFNLS